MFPSAQTPNAVSRLRNLLNGPTPQLIRIGVRNKGCAGLSYHLDYVDKPGKFDEVVVQDGVRALIDSMALFSIIGSEMDWKEDQLRCVKLVIAPKFALNISSILVRNLSSRTPILKTLAVAESHLKSSHNLSICIIYPFLSLYYPSCLYQHYIQS